MAKIAYLGMGIMGSGMAANLVDAGHDVTVWNRTKQKCKPLEEKGAKVADTPSDAIAGAEVVMYCLADDDAVSDVVFGEDGLLAGAAAGQLFVDMSTVHPDTSRREATAYEAKEASFVDAPVFGTKPHAAGGELWIVAGGSRDDMDRLKPLFEPISQSVHHMGDVGKGASMKLVGNMVVASMMETLGEAMTLAKKADLPMDEVLEVLDETDFQSPLFKGVGSSVLDRNFETSFALKWMLKDANLIAAFARDLNVPAPAASVVCEQLKASVNQGWGEDNASSVIRQLEAMSGVELTRG